MSCLADIDVAILCGGKGTRARSYLGDTPKVLALLGGSPFIEHHIDYLRDHGAKRIILLAGHGHDQVRDWLVEHPIPDVIVVKDTKLQGCGRALKDVAGVFSGYRILITNGDTFLIGDLKPFIEHAVRWYTEQPAVMTVGGVSTGVTLMPISCLVYGEFAAASIEALFDFSFIDIGTLEGYRRAQEHFGDYNKDAV